MNARDQRHAQKTLHIQSAAQVRRMSLVRAPPPHQTARCRTSSWFATLRSHGFHARWPPCTTSAARTMRRRRSRRRTYMARWSRHTVPSGQSGCQAGAMSRPSRGHPARGVVRPHRQAGVLCQRGSLPSSVPRRGLRSSCSKSGYAACRHACSHQALPCSAPADSATHARRLRGARRCVHPRRRKQRTSSR